MATSYRRLDSVGLYIDIYINADVAVDAAITMEHRTQYMYKDACF